MTPDAPAGPPPRPFTVRCAVCSRWTTAPVAIRHYGSISGGSTVTLYACPTDAATAAPGSLPEEFTHGDGDKR
ncbi:hypothetical protein ACFV0R_09160 [Streptomyces sp. NPDC059578]|uniref:hypothetical protein n=1 Tax=Streptomyces sp. NPDC059578 TaxID=3346874 RepID=UPI003695388A